MKASITTLEHSKSAMVSGLVKITNADGDTTNVNMVATNKAPMIA